MKERHTKVASLNPILLAAKSFDHEDKSVKSPFLAYKFMFSLTGRLTLQPMVTESAESKEKRMYMKMLSIFVGLMFAVPALSAQKPDWQKHLDWSISNSDAGGSVDCPDKYLATYPECHLKDGRACMMRKAIQSAKDNDCANALRVSVITQCHNVTARDEITKAGQTAVCKYLKTK